METTANLANSAWPEIEMFGLTDVNLAAAILNIRPDEGLFCAWALPLEVGQHAFWLVDLS